LVTRRRLVLTALLSLTSFAASINLLFAGLIRMAAEFNTRPEVLAAISSVYFVAFVSVSLVAGFASSRYGTRLPLLLGGMCTCAGGLIFLLGRGPAALVLGALAMGAGGGATEGMCSALLAGLFPGRERFVVSISQAGYCFGAIAGPFLMSIFLPLGVNWRIFFAPVAALALLNVILFAGSRFPSSRPEDQLSPRAAVGVLRRPSVRQWCFVVFLYVLAEAGLTSFLNIYLFEYEGAQEGVAIQAIALFWGVMLAGRLLTGLLPASVADRKLIVGGMSLGAVLVAALLVVSGWGPSLAVILLASFAMAGAWPTAVALTAVENRDVSSTAVGVTVAFGAVGCIVSPLVMGRLFGLVPPAVAMVAPALPLIAGALLALPRPVRVPVLPAVVGEG